MTRANARIELAIKGQMGQPAACMMENKEVLRSSEKIAIGLWRTVHLRLPTNVVDNFVEKYLQNCCSAMIDAPCDALMTN